MKDRFLIFTAYSWIPCPSGRRAACVRLGYATARRAGMTKNKDWIAARPPRLADARRGARNNK